MTVRPHPANGMPNKETEQTTLAGIITVAILGVIILCIVVYFKFYRKFKRMKTELAHVHYIADPIQNGKLYQRLILSYIACQKEFEHKVNIEAKHCPNLILDT